MYVPWKLPHTYTNVHHASDPIVLLCAVPGEWWVWRYPVNSLGRKVRT